MLFKYFLFSFIIWEQILLDLYFVRFSKVKNFFNIRICNLFVINSSLGRLQHLQGYLESLSYLNIIIFLLITCPCKLIDKQKIRHLIIAYVSPPIYFSLKYTPKWTPNLTCHILLLLFLPIAFNTVKVNFKKYFSPENKR